MIKRIQVTNFQSLKSIDLELGAFTVIVGPSSSGKTALLRAIKALVSNTRDGSIVSHGTKAASVRALVSAPDSSAIIEFQRSASTASYVLTRSADPGNPQSYAKLAGTVPQAVTEALGIAPPSATDLAPGILSSDLTIASQFDRPFLLDESGSKVASVLGSLTNVSIIFDAAKEASRRKNQISQSLKIRQGDFERILAQLEEFRSLPKQIESLNSLEETIRIAQSIELKISTFQSLTDSYYVAYAALKEISTRSASIVIPDLSPILALRDRIERLTLLQTAVEKATRDLALTVSIINESTDTIESSQARLSLVLREARECPMCGQSTVDLHPGVPEGYERSGRRSKDQE